MPSQSETKRQVKLSLGLCNILMICVGVLITCEAFEYISVFPATYISFTIIMGATMAVCGVLGFAAIFSENLRIIIAYAIIWLVAIFVQMTGICFAHRFDDLIKENARNLVQKQWHEELVHPGAMDNFQIEFQCCGNDSSHDYTKILHRVEIPSSCYNHSNATGTTLYTEGCFTAAEKTIYYSYAVFSRACWASVILTFMQISGIGYLIIILSNNKRWDYLQP